VFVQSSDSTVVRIDSAAAVGRGDSGWSVVAAGQSFSTFRVRFVGSGTARIRISGRGFSPDSSLPLTVTGPSLHLYYTTVTTGLNQIFQGEFVYLDNAVTGTPLFVSLLRSDSSSTSPFVLSATSVTIPVGSSSSPAFEVTGQNAGSALLIARASGYNQATATVPVGQPRLATNYTTLSLYVGAPPTPVTVYTQDQTSAYRIVASALQVGDTSSAPGIAVGDSATFTIAARTSSSSVGVRGLQKGSAAVIFSAPSYRSDTLQVSVDTATLLLSSPPNGLGPGQTGQMTVSIPFAAPAAVTVNLSSSASGALAVPATATIPVNASSATFTVTGVGQGTANVGATATGFYAAALLPVAVGSPKLGLGLASTVVVGQKQVVTVYAEDANGATRNVSQPLVVTLVSSLPGHASFDSSTTTIPVGSYYVQTGVTFDSAATYTIGANAPNYAAASQLTTATGALVTMIAPTTFSPATVTISAGQYVTWKNTDTITHTTTADASSALQWDSGNVAPGATSSVYFPAPGTYTYHCTIHGAIMSGTVIVQ
jgi:plastocyanin